MYKIWAEEIQNVEQRTVSLPQKAMAKLERLLGETFGQTGINTLKID